MGRIVKRLHFFRQTIFIHFHTLSSISSAFIPFQPLSSIFTHFRPLSYSFIHFQQLSSEFIHFHQLSSIFIPFHPLPTIFIHFLSTFIHFHPSPPLCTLFPSLRWPKEAFKSWQLVGCQLLIMAVVFKVNLSLPLTRG